MRRDTFALLCLALAGPAAALDAPAAGAHANLLDPNPRNLVANKTGPCGVPRTSAPTTFTAGETITINWIETIEHPGWYRIAFSPSGDQGFDDNILLDDIPDTQGGTMPHEYNLTVTLPDTPCTDCTLQLIQYMTEQTPPSLYFSCADIVLEAPAPADAGPPPDPSAPDAGPSSAPPDPEGPGLEIGDPPGLCSAGGSSSTTPGTAAPLFLLVLFPLATRRRRG